MHPKVSLNHQLLRRTVWFVKFTKSMRTRSERLVRFQISLTDTLFTLVRIPLIGPSCAGIIGVHPDPKELEDLSVFGVLLDHLITHMILLIIRVCSNTGTSASLCRS